jgi:hypothetical protein
LRLVNGDTEGDTEGETTGDDDPFMTPVPPVDVFVRGVRVTGPE